MARKETPSLNGRLLQRLWFLSRAGMREFVSLVLNFVAGIRALVAIDVSMVITEC
jgi:hypothetical protein